MYVKLYVSIIKLYLDPVFKKKKKSVIKVDISFIWLSIDLKILINTEQMLLSFTEKPVNIITA